MSDYYRLFGRWIFRHRIAFVMLWSLALALATPVAHRAPWLLDAGSGTLEGSVPSTWKYHPASDPARRENPL